MHLRNIISDTFGAGVLQEMVGTGTVRQNDMLTGNVHRKEGQLQKQREQLAIEWCPGIN